MSENTESENIPQSESTQEENSKRDLVFDLRFLEDLTFWVDTNRKTALRLLSIIEEIRRNPFEGTGKPERLKYQDANVWSRRLTQTDRIVYLVSQDRIEFLQARYHYSDR
ncbi:Txe/YoeB family addiction module toxin [Lyngbya sp. CCAP 1446/10]|uniref:Txe/YoeB family addiction module toxin n=1 Tax=Lyngbya sp. CCAP 1446/10 TaxID=439293 RepID=UPI0022380DBF|nr:Txe/YoeB family addiction module toxin [Lyngbya sp. CCAP 1446/10]MCW6051711.1 Txe/YoeB family addiction module toxin [Lyngbya sp. CCAP 1446/10]